MKKEIACPHPKCGSQDYVNLGPINGAANFSKEMFECLECGNFFKVIFDAQGEIDTIEIF